MSEEREERLKELYEQLGRKFYREFGKVELEDPEYRRLFEQVKALEKV
ncbi:MAG: hypothetical protein IJ274_03900 [Lachnospiraceae bacterium]|nr:hypothetical protein [Lachnospiraceae bacterium]